MNEHDLKLRNNALNGCFSNFQNYSVLDVRPPHTVIALNNSMYWQDFEDACVYECLDGKDCQSFFCCFEECKGGAWRKGRVHIDLLELDAYSRVFFPTSFLLFNVVYWVGYLYLQHSAGHCSVSKGRQHNLTKEIQV